MNRNIDNTIGYQVGVVAHFIRNTYMQRLSEYDLTVAQAKVLFMLVTHGDQLQAKLQNRLYIRASTMNGIIDSMLKKQLITKTDSHIDRRSKIISISEKGRALEERLWSDRALMDETIVKGFSSEEKQLLFAALLNMKKNLLELEEGK